MESSSHDSCIDPVFYDSTPWELYLVETNIELVRTYFEDTKRSSFYARDIHRTPIYALDKKPWEFSGFVQLKQSAWTRFLVGCYGRNWSAQKGRTADLSKIFETRALVFGFEDTGDTLYYELFQNGCWKESYAHYGQAQPHEKAFEFKSEIRPDCRPGKDERIFIEETFRWWNIRVPFITIDSYEKNPHLIQGSLPKPPLGSVFTNEDIKGFDCALIHTI